MIKEFVLNMTHYTGRRMSFSASGRQVKALLENAFIVLMWVFAVVPDVFAVGVDSDMGFVVCKAADMVGGEIGAGIATIGVCTIGASACFGRISWPMAIGVIAGLGGFFGALDVVKLFVSSPSVCP